MRFPSKLERMLDAGAIVEWRPVKDYEGLYAVSNEGDVKSFARVDSNNHPVRERILKQAKASHGYLTVSLFKNGEGKQYCIHRLVARAYIGECPAGYQVNHINENKVDNRLDNLEYVTPKKNINHGTCKERSARARINNPKISIPVESFDLKSHKTIAQYPSMMAAERDGYDETSICRCLSGKLKSHYGVGFRKQTNG